jgi:hypothetical protein
MPLVIPPDFAVVFEAYLYCRVPAAVRFVQLSVLNGRLRRVKRYLFDLLHLRVNTGDALTQKVLRNGWAAGASPFWFTGWCDMPRVRIWRHIEMVQQILSKLKIFCKFLLRCAAAEALVNMNIPG